MFFQNYIVENKLAKTEILDLRTYNFPIFSEILKKQVNPDAKTLEFAEKINTSDGIIIVTPEYNGGVPASLKNAIDVLYEEWRHKPVGIVTVSGGPFAGSQVLVSLQFTLWKMKAWTITEQFSVPNIEKSFSESGKPFDKGTSEKLADLFLKELLWCIKADTSKAL